MHFCIADAHYLLMILVTLVWCSQSSFWVLDQSGGQQGQKMKSIPYSLANFGNVPFGQTLFGDLIEWSDQSHQCQFPQNQTVPTEGAFMLIPSGGGNTVSKALQAQAHLVRVAIIVDYTWEGSVVRMADHGNGYLITIPVILIHPTLGQRIQQMIRTNNHHLKARLQFQTKKYQKVNVILWLRSYNAPSYKLIKEFEQYYQKILLKINLTLIYSLQPCSQCLSRDCYFQSHFCSVSMNLGGLSGRQVIDQQLREAIVFKEYPEHWWGYINGMDQCRKAKAKKQCCRDKAMTQIGINKSLIEARRKQSFSADGNNSMLWEYQQQLRRSGVKVYPSVTLNNISMKGVIDAEFLFQEICNSLEVPPLECDQALKSTQTQSQFEQYWTGILQVTLIGLFIFNLLFFIYRHYSRNNIRTKMEARVNEMVNNYINLQSREGTHSRSGDHTHALIDAGRDTIQRLSDPNERLSDRVSEPSDRVSEPSDRASEPSDRVSEPVVSDILWSDARIGQ